MTMTMTNLITESYDSVKQARPDCVSMIMYVLTIVVQTMTVSYCARGSSPSSGLAGGLYFSMIFMVRLS